MKKNYTLGVQNKTRICPTHTEPRHNQSEGFLMDNQFSGLGTAYSQRDAGFAGMSVVIRCQYTLRYCC